MQKRMLEGKNAIVTGSTKGIGLAIAEAFAKEGANLVIVSRTASDCEVTAKRLMEEYKIKAYAIPADLSGNEGRENLVLEAKKHFDKIDILVNNAGSSFTKRAEYITEDEWDKVINLDLKSIFFLSQSVGKIMIEQKSGKIINIASMLGLVAIKGVLPYCVAKGGVIQMTKALALEWAKKGITVNALCPGYVITDINRENMSRPEVMEKLVTKMPLGRCGEVSEVAQGALFLASEGSSYMTGQCLVLDGGYTAQ